MSVQHFRCGVTVNHGKEEIYLDFPLLFGTLFPKAQYSSLTVKTIQDFFACMKYSRHLGGADHYYLRFADGKNYEVYQLAYNKDCTFNLYTSAVGTPSMVRLECIWNDPKSYNPYSRLAFSTTGPMKFSVQNYIDSIELLWCNKLFAFPRDYEVKVNLLVPMCEYYNLKWRWK